MFSFPPSRLSPSLPLSFSLSLPSIPLPSPHPNSLALPSRLASNLRVFCLSLLSVVVSESQTCSCLSPSLCHPDLVVIFESAICALSSSPSLSSSSSSHPFLLSFVLLCFPLFLLQFFELVPLCCLGRPRAFSDPPASTSGCWKYRYQPPH